MPGSPGERPRVYMQIGTGVACQCPLSLRQSLAPLALVLTAGGLSLDLPCALLVCAVADCALINLHLSAGRYHCCVRVAIWPCVCARQTGNRERDAKGFVLTQWNSELIHYIFL